MRISWHDYAGVDFVPVSSPMIVMAPRCTADDVVAMLSDAVVAITMESAYVDTMTKVGLPVASISGPDTAAALDSAKADWAKLLESLERARHVIVGLALIAIAGFFHYSSFSISLDFVDEEGMGPQFFPQAICIALALFRLREQAAPGNA